MGIQRFFLLFIFAVSVLVVGLAAFLVLKTEREPAWAAAFLSLATGIVSAFGVLKQTKTSGQERKRKMDRSLATVATPAKPFPMAHSFDSGLYGGLIGGALAGLIIGGLYYIGSQNDPASGAKPNLVIILLIFGYAAVTGATFGVCSQQAIYWFRRAATEGRYSGLFFNEVTGGILGGGLGGILAGALGGGSFGLLPYPLVDSRLLIAGSVCGAFCLALGILLYDYEGRWQTIIRPLIVSMVIAAFIAPVGFVVLQALDFGDRFFGEPTTWLLVTVGGAIVGLVVCIVLGILLGITLLSYRLSRTETEPVMH